MGTQVFCVLSVRANLSIIVKVYRNGHQTSREDNSEIWKTKIRTYKTGGKDLPPKVKEIIYYYLFLKFHFKYCSV